MPTRKRRIARRLAVQVAELAFAVPQVVGHRVTRMALAGGQPNARDRREFQRMGAEKTAAFAESWMAMAMQAAVAQQRFALGLMRSGVWPFSWGSAVTDWHRVANTVLGHGMAPVHRRAVANAKRLRTTRLK